MSKQKKNLTTTASLENPLPEETPVVDEPKDISAEQPQEEKAEETPQEEKIEDVPEKGNSEPNGVLKEPEEKEELKEVPKEEPRGIFCEYCKRNHAKTFDRVGEINHDKFDLGGKAEIMFEYLCNQPTSMTFIPLMQGEKPNSYASVHQFTRNGLRINVAKNKPVNVPLPIAESIKESQDATAKAYAYVRTKNMNNEGFKNARLDLLSEKEKEIFE